MKSLSPLKRETTLTKLVILVMMTFLNIVSVELIRFFLPFPSGRSCISSYLDACLGS